MTTRRLYWFEGRWRTRQQVWQLRRKAEGKCVQCAKPAVGGTVHCLKCGIKKRDYEHARHNCKRYYQSKIRLLENQP